jgi:hypothetical protein
MPRKSLPVILSKPEISRLEQWLRAGSTPQQVVLRAKIILRASQGESDQQIARELKLQRRTAALWRCRVREQGIGCVWDIAPGRGRKAFYGKAHVTRIIGSDASNQAQGGDALEQSHSGWVSGREQKHDSSHLAGAPTQAAFDQEFHGIRNSWKN